MAETPKKKKAKTTAKAAKPKAAKPKAAKAKSSASKSVAKPSKGKARKPKSVGAPASTREDAVAPRKEAPIGPAANVALARQAALAGSKAAGRAVTVAASKAKVPIVAGGGMLAGIAGGLAVVRRRNGRAAQPTLDVDRVVAAARRAGSFGEELGRLASMLEQAGAASKRK